MNVLYQNSLIIINTLFLSLSSLALFFSCVAVIESFSLQINEMQILNLDIEKKNHVSFKILFTSWIEVVQRSLQNIKYMWILVEHLRAIWWMIIVPVFKHFKANSIQFFIYHIEIASLNSDLFLFVCFATRIIWMKRRKKKILSKMRMKITEEILKSKSSDYLFTTSCPHCSNRHYQVFDFRVWSVWSLYFCINSKNKW